MISVAEACRLLAAITPLPPLRVAIDKACGHVLGETPLADEAVPPVRQFRGGRLRRQDR